MGHIAQQWLSRQCRVEAAVQRRECSVAPNGGDAARPHQQILGDLQRLSGPVLPLGTPLSQKMFWRNSSGNLDRGGTCHGGVENTVPRLSLFLSHFWKSRTLAVSPQVEIPVRFLGSKTAAEKIASVERDFDAGRLGP